MAEALPFLGALGGVGALITALVVLSKVGVEKTDVKITTADKVLVGQARWIDNLEETLKDYADRLDENRKKLDEQGDQLDLLKATVGRLSAELKDVTAERDRLRSENQALRARVEELERRVAELTNGP